MNQEQIEQILEDALQHFLTDTSSNVISSALSNIVPANNNPSSHSRPSLDISLNPSPELIRLMLWSNLTSEYQQNIRLYQNNMNALLRNQTGVQSGVQTASIIIGPLTESRQSLPTIPTIQQLSNATIIFVYNEETRTRVGENQTCPITFEEFVNGDILSQIVHCSHVFKEQPLRNWFSQNTFCPVCRYDIRT